MVSTTIVTILYINTSIILNLTWYRHTGSELATAVLSSPNVTDVGCLWTINEIFYVMQAQTFGRHSWISPPPIVTASYYDFSKYMKFITSSRRSLQVFSWYIRCYVFISDPKPYMHCKCTVLNYSSTTNYICGRDSITCSWYERLGTLSVIYITFTMNLYYVLSTHITLVI